MKIEKIVLATEIKDQNPKVLNEILEMFKGQDIEIEYVSHSELKKTTKTCNAVVLQKIMIQENLCNH